jgi:predicted N-acetyltransferase YhbS
LADQDVIVMKPDSLFKRAPMQWTIKTESESQVPDSDILELVEKALGENWTTRSSHQLRLGNQQDENLSLVAFLDGKLVGTVRLWPIQAGTAGDALLLGPLAIEPKLQGLGLGKEMMLKVIELAKARGHGAIVLVGDAPYYERVGFSAKPTWAMRMPGRYDQNRLLGLELKPNYLSSQEGVISR